MNVIGIAGWSGAGKTTLLTRLIPVLSARGLRVSTLKHAHHSFDVDVPGKDSHSHREAGATEVLVASPKRFALMHELRDEAEPLLADLLGYMSPVDLVLVEGFKHERHPKIELHRVAVGKALLYPNDPNILALATDATGLDIALPVFHLDDVEAIADFVIAAALPVTSVIATLRAATA